MFRPFWGPYIPLLTKPSFGGIPNRREGSVDEALPFLHLDGDIILGTAMLGGLEKKRGNFLTHGTGFAIIP